MKSYFFAPLVAVAFFAGLALVPHRALAHDEDSGDATQSDDSMMEASDTMMHDDAHMEGDDSMYASDTMMEDDSQMDDASGHMESGMEHKSAVANIAQKLRTLAGKDLNVGSEIGAVAKEQEDVSQESSDAMDAVEARGKFQTFLFGTDYKNIGVIRSTIVTTENHINRLENAKARTSDEALKAELDTQIGALTDEKSNVEAFVEEHENAFSIFGWLVRLLTTETPAQDGTPATTTSN